MIDNAVKVTYKAFGLNITSDIPLPEFPLSNLYSHDIADVEIHTRDLSQVWTEAGGVDNSFIAKENNVMFHIADVAIYLIENGNEISVSPFAGSNEDQVRLYLLGTCMGIVLQQRKILPLHGSVIAIEGKAYAFVGDSGAGKSTLASAFLSRGYQLLTDDVIPIEFTEEGCPIVVPSYPHQKLWQESLDQFGVESAQYRPLFGRETKFAVPVTSQFMCEPMPLAGIFELVKSADDDIIIQPIMGLERLHTLYKHTYRNFIIPPSGLMDWHFTVSTRIISKVDLFQLRRPISRFTAHDLPDVILEAIKTAK